MGTFTTTEPYPKDFVPQLLRDTWRRHLAGEKPAAFGPDGFPIYADQPWHAEHARLSDYIKEASRKSHEAVVPDELGRIILELDADAKLRLAFATLERLPWFWKTGVREAKRLGILKGWEYEEPPWRWTLGPLLVAVLRGARPFTPEQFALFLSVLAEPPRAELVEFATPYAVVRQAQGLWPVAVPEPAFSALRSFEILLKEQHWGRRADERRLLEELAQLLGANRQAVIETGEAWSDRATTFVAKLASGPQVAWVELLEHCYTAQTSKPTKKWLATTRELVIRIGEADFKRATEEWFELVALPRPIHCEHRYPHLPDPDWLIGERNAVVLKGLVWSCSGLTDADVGRALSTLAEVCFKKVRWLGPRCPKVGNACLYVLSNAKTEDAAAQLSRLDATVVQPTARKRIDKSLNQAAELTGQTREDLEEKAVPTYGLDDESKQTRVLEEFTATIQIEDSRTAELTWRKGEKAVKTIPAEVKRSHAEELKDIQRVLKDIQKMLPAQRVRIERLLMTERRWDLEVWRERYSNQPLLAPIARRLIWHFQLGERTSLGAWRDGKIVDVEGKALDWLAPETKVRLWHPIGFPVETVQSWRRWLETNEVCQPFKQAHREIYVLTDAELTTDTYSNRFAAHIIGQHQFAALAKQRGWKYSFMGGFDFQCTPTLELPAWGLAAEFWVQPADEMADSGVARYLTTDQVRFTRDGEAIPLRDVPATVFTEVMRDVDLFVGVGSIGNDPAWQDQGAVEGGNDYWQSYSFGELSATAQTRHDVIERLLPKLKIAGQCSLEKKFLVVKGSLRTYKIHLGSGNILMEPNDQYLCIVPERGGASAKAGEKVFLPFEGDGTLSVILSKAFLLAEDQKIKDETILRQIKPA